MYQCGDYIVYGTNGVCKIAEIGTPGFSQANKSKRYYTLIPVYGVETIYVPVDTGAYMRPVMSREEAEALIAQIPAIREDAVDIRNLQLLSEHYKASFQSHDSAELIHLIKTIYLKCAHAEMAGKKPCVVDQRFRKRAEDLLHGELAVALGIPRESVPDYIKERISGPQQKNA